MIRILGPYCIALVWGWLLALRLRTSIGGTLWLLLGSVLLALTVYGLSGLCLYGASALLCFFAVCGGSFALQRSVFALLRSSRVRSS